METLYTIVDYIGVALFIIIALAVLLVFSPFLLAIIIDPYVKRLFKEEYPL